MKENVQRNAIVFHLSSSESREVKCCLGPGIYAKYGWKLIVNIKLRIYKWERARAINYRYIYNIIIIISESSFYIV